MKPIRTLFAICTAGLLVLCACSGDKTSPPLSPVNDAVASDLIGDATGAGGQDQPGARPSRLGVPGPLDNERIPQGGTYDPSSGRFVVPSETDERGATIMRSYAFLDAAGAAQTAYDQDLTTSISLRFTLDARPSRDGHTGTIHVEHDLVASGLVGSEAMRTWNGTMSERTEGVPPMGGPGGRGDTCGPGNPGGAGGPGESNPLTGGPDPTNMKMTAVNTIRNVVMPHPLGAETWPLSGSITRVEHLEGGPNGAKERTSVLTFNGTQYATLVTGDETVQIDLKDPRPPRPPQP